VPYDPNTPRRVDETRLARSARVKMSCPKYFLSPAGFESIESVGGILRLETHSLRKSLVIAHRASPPLRGGARGGGSARRARLPPASSTPTQPSPSRGRALESVRIRLAPS